jgi:hypothetical protein
VLRVIEPKWLTLTETMSRVRARIESVIGYAMTAGHRPPADNPARWDKHIENLLPAKNYRRFVLSSLLREQDARSRYQAATGRDL